MENMERLILELDDEDRRILPKWRVKCIELWNEKVREVLREYHVRRLGGEKPPD